MSARMLAFAIATNALAASAASALTLDLPGEAQRQVVRYACSDGQDRSAEYVTVGANILALLEIDGETRVFVATIAASGVRYASGAFLWWTKGTGATLFDAMTDNDPGITCKDVDAAN